MGGLPRHSDCVDVREEGGRGCGYDKKPAIAVRLPTTIDVTQVALMRSGLVMSILAIIVHLLLLFGTRVSRTIEMLANPSVVAAAWPHVSSPDGVIVP